MSLKGRADAVWEVEETMTVRAPATDATACKLSFCHQVFVLPKECQPVQALFRRCLWTCRVMPAAKAPPLSPVVWPPTTPPSSLPLDALHRIRKEQILNRYHSTRVSSSTLSPTLRLAQIALHCRRRSFTPRLFGRPSGSYLPSTVLLPVDGNSRAALITS